MLQVSADVLALSADPALLAKGGRIVYANAAACRLFGADCTGQTIRAALGEEIASVQSGSFLGELNRGGQRYLLRVQALDGLQVYYLRESAICERLVSDSFLVALRGALMDLQAAITLLKNRLAPEGGNACPELAPLSRSFFQINRILTNVSVIHGVENGSVLFLPRPIDLSRFLRELADSVSLLFAAPELAVFLPETCPCTADPALLESLVLNLLSNAMRHAEGCTRISLRLSLLGEQLLLSVSDDGCGIPAEEMHTVFDRFRHQHALTQLGSGAGLGLTTAQEIAHLHGGTLLLESREGLGTAVRASLNRVSAPLSLHTPIPAYDQSYNCILTGLADCLPAECFDGALTE
ncbi:MAG: PAS domain-containing protein [Oscillospiraceae bacterium]|nr:PAS domain-containing protein [Oscillospiraceae bacterium]